jgi:hypothetical protein
LLPDAVFELLEPQLREQLKDPGLPMAERLARETELKSKWIELQRHFVALTLADGLPMPLAHPYAILGVMPGTTRDLRQNYLTVTEDAGAPLNVGLPVKDLPTLEEQGVPDIPRRNRRARK